MKLKFPILFLLIIFTSSCVREAQVDMPGFNYMEKKIFLNVGAIQVINEYRPKKKDLRKTMLPASIISELDHWLRNRFIAAGKQGIAIIRIKDAEVMEKGLHSLDNTHETFTSGQPDKFGVSANIVVEVQQAPDFAEGKAEVTLSRHISVESDVKMAFRLQIWAAFLQSFMNALDDQFILNVETYLPGIIVPAFVVNQMAKKELEESEIKEATN